ALLAAMFALSAWAQTSLGQIQSISSSNVEGYFGSQSDVVQQAEGPTIPPWGVNGPGFYPITGVPNVPPLYPSFPNPLLSMPSNIPFAPGGHALASAFLDNQTTTASYNIIGGVTGAGTLTEDAYVDLGAPGTVGLFLKQPPTATGYAYEQVNFAEI